MSHSEPVAYDWIDGVEQLEKYEPGGYCPVTINELLQGRYRIVDKLGYGGYSTIWLARDGQAKRYVAIKVKPVSGTMYSDVDASDTIPIILDEFDLHSPNGIHPCYTVAPAQGNLREASFSRLFPIEVARALAAKLTIAVAFIHSRGFVHGDLHLRNVLVKLPSDFDDLSVDQFREKYSDPETQPIHRVDKKPLSANVPSEAVLPLYLGKKAQEFTLADAQGLILNDFGESFAPDTVKRLGKDCNTPTAKKAPEALFEPEAPLSYPSDIWSLGTAIWEILGMKFIFSEAETQNIIVAQQIEVLGHQNFPVNWRESWERSSKAEAGVDEGKPRRPEGNREAWPPLREAFEEFIQKYRRKREAAGTFGEEETEAILDLMRGMLRFRPEERLTVDEVLRSEWMTRWALPQLSHIR